MQDSVLTEHLRRGDHVVIAQATAEPVSLVRALFEAAPRIGSLDAFCGYSLNPAWSSSIDPALSVSTYCGLGTIGPAVARGTARVVPAQLSQLCSYFDSGVLKADVVLLQVSPADADGYHSLGCAVDYVWNAVQVARVVLVEINSCVPRTRSSFRLHSSRVIAVARSDMPLPELAAEPPTEAQLVVGCRVARLVPDGAIVQLGIGSMAAAVARALSQHRGLRVRSGMVGDWLLDLVANGATDRADPDACMASMAVGTSCLYEWAAAHANLRFASPTQLVAPLGAAAAAPFMAINSALEVDLRGQANAELAGMRYAGAVGGQPDYFRAARRSSGGLAILAMTSTAGKANRSRVVLRLNEGYVSAAQSDVDVIVTEYGTADIRATTFAERQHLIAALAEPSFRAGLVNREDAAGA